MVYPREVGTKNLVLVFFRTWRIKWMGKYYGPFEPIKFTAINRHYHLGLGRVLLSMMPVKGEIWHNF
jgi:hypothetical protein